MKRTPATTHAHGDTIVIRTVTGGRIRWAGPAIFVSETEETVAYYRPPGTLTKVTGGARVTTSRRDRELALRSELLRRQWALFDYRPAGPGTLVVSRSSDWFSCLLQPDAHTGDFIPWYVNIETPHVRTKFGFDIDDLCLDVVIDSSLKFALKDADDLAERAKIGIYEPAQVAAIRASAAAAIARIESRQPPFDGSWAGWRPDPSWRTPALLRGWDIVENTA